MKQKPSKMVAFRMPMDLYKCVVEVLGSGESFSSFVREAILNELKRRTNQ